MKLCISCVQRYIWWVCMCLCHLPSMNRTFLMFFSVRPRVKSSSEEPACCNVPRVSSFFSPERARARQRERGGDRKRERERERERERDLSYILVGQPHPEGWGEDEKGRGGEESRRKERGEHSILGNMRRAESSLGEASSDLLRRHC